MSGIASIIVAALPYVPALIEDIANLFKKYPQLSPAEISAAVTAASQQSDSAFNDALATLNQVSAPAIAPAAEAPAAK
jgi:hypothetical protein